MPEQGTRLNPGPSYSAALFQRRETGGELALGLPIAFGGERAQPTSHGPGRQLGFALGPGGAGMCAVVWYGVSVALRVQCRNLIPIALRGWKCNWITASKGVAFGR
jgi:hypothetical protein